MNRYIGLLAVLLLLQLGVIGATALYPSGDAGEAGAWIDFTADELTGLRISDGENSIALTREAEKWQIEGVDADASQVAGLLDKLKAIRAPWPVATTRDSAERFEVNPDSFQRRLELLSGEEVVADVFLGTSPGFQRVHARLAESEEIYSVELSNYELPVTVDGWFDKALLATATVPDEIEVNFVDDGRTVSLVNTEEGWLVDGEAADQEVAATYANRYTSLRVMNIAGDIDEYVTVAGIRLRVGDAWRELSIRKRTDGDDADYMISVPEAAQRFALATFIAEQLLLTDVELSAEEASDAAEQDEAEAPVEQTE